MRVVAGHVRVAGAIRFLHRLTPGGYSRAILCVFAHDRGSCVGLGNHPARPSIPLLPVTGLAGGTRGP